MQSTAKADALIRRLQDDLSKRYAPDSAGLNSVRLGRDAAGWPMLFASNSTAGEGAGNPVLALRIRNVDMVSKDVFGGDTYAYAPHILELAYELDGAGAPLVAAADRVAAEFESIKTGCRWQLKEIPNGTAVDEASMDAASPSADLEELYWPTKSV